MTILSALQQVFAAIDDANAHDPGRDTVTGEPAALLYGRRMSARLAMLASQAEPELAIAARGQHVERWTVPRSDFPMTRAGYLHWRNHLKDFHATRLGQMMQAAGFDAPVVERMGSIVRKERFKTDPQAQALEDVACLVFLEFYAPAFVIKHDEAKVVDIVRKTWGKMSAQGQAYAAGLSLAPDVARFVQRALGGAPAS